MSKKRIKKLSKDEIEENYEEYYYSDSDEIYVDYLDDYYNIVYVWNFIDLDNPPEGVSFDLYD